MEEKKMNRPLLYLLGFLCGRSVVLGIAPFIIPAFAAIYYMKKSTLGLILAMLFGGLSIYAGSGFVNFEIFEVGPYVMTETYIPVTYFLIKYITMIIFLLFCCNLLEYIAASGAKNPHKKKSGTGRYFESYYRKKTASAVITAVVVFAVSLLMGFFVYKPAEAFLMAFCEMVISVCMVPVLKRGFMVMVFNDRERDKYNEELLGVLALVAVCMWGMPVNIGGLVPWLPVFGLYISWYFIQRYGAGYGMAVAGIAGVITAIRTEKPEFVGSYFIIGVIILVGRIISDKRKIGVLISATTACMLTSLFYYDYFLSTEGLEIAGLAVLIFAATPKWMISVRDGWINNRYDEKTAAEMNRITAGKIRELSGAFKRIEYTLAGCGPAAAKVNLAEVGEMIGRFSDNLSSAEPVPVNDCDILKTKFLEQGVVVTHLSTMKNEMNRSQFYITARTKNKKIMLSKDAADIMSDVFDRPVRVSVDSSAIISENDRVIVFEESAKYRCSFYVRRIKKYGSNVSGDNFSVKEHEDGRLIMMISDGMGSGSLASCESTLMIDTMEEMMDAGFDPSYAISFSNDCISEKNNGRSFTTFDMGIVDLYDGTLTQYKQGAAPTYIIHGNEDGVMVEVIRGTTLPIGILPEAECDVVKTNLKDGDIIVMLSDGATDCCDDMSDILKDTADREPRDILEHIVTEVLYRNRGKLSDDVTVIVAGMEENDEG